MLSEPSSDNLKKTQDSATFTAVNRLEKITISAHNDLKETVMKKTHDMQITEALLEDNIDFSTFDFNEFLNLSADDDEVVNIFADEMMQLSNTSADLLKSLSTVFIDC
ncbi:hypothetical protein EMPG_10054 [Blastomyces silverae]|uniref:Uncharacterized protein n=1 Tax=Blastomyces silverae TaxID=2060906 RepID=A0A0H1B641_9EURO|nr:hypothetical protein EMPG_10054 [Blastomyces silverae]